MTDSRLQIRLPGIDVLRGIAVGAMIIFHFAWDLRFFGLIETNISQHPFWANFARAIAGSFLILSGISLVLLTRDGFDREKFLRRLGIIGGAALLVTVATFFSMPKSFIFFGILHCIALSSVLALPFLRLPMLVTAGVAVVVFALPLVFTHPVFDIPWLQWTGLGMILPFTNDYVPVFPWFALALAGVVIGKLIVQSPPVWLQDKPEGALAFTAKAGRLSLPIYLLHQPMLMALIGAASLAVPSSGPDKITLEFREACQASCVKAGETGEICARYCTCAEGNIRKAELWTPLLRNNLTARQQQQVTAITEQCQAKAQ
jgi:uncharacterized membrane protein